MVGKREKPRRSAVENQLRAAGFATALSMLAFAYLWLLAAPYPALGQFLSRQQYSRTWLDRNGELLYVEPLSGGLRREFVALDSVPQSIVRIFLASEDARFYAHPGVDPSALLRSLVRNTLSGRVVSGASTITMQLSRIIEPHDRSLRGKLRELVRSLMLEARLTKHRILELWLNSVPFSFGVDGLQSASRLFFGKPASALTDSEGALLSVIPRRPASNNPDSINNSLRPVIRDLLKRTGSLEGDEDLEQAWNAFAFHQWPFEAPHFMLRAMAESLPPGEQDGEEPTAFRTSLDLQANRYAQDLLQMELSRFSTSRLSTGAILALDNATGEIRVYIGSRSFYDDKNSGQIDGVRVTNQPGSTLKPFLYAFGLDNGYLPNSILPDIPTDFGSGEAYTPSNFNNRYNGPVRLRVALSSSLNVPAVYLLTQLGVGTVTDFLVSLGFQSLIPQRENLGAGLALGNAEVSLLELTRAFALFPRGGLTLSLTCRVRGGGAENTSDPYGFPDNGSWETEGANRAVSRYSALMICNILSDNASRFTGFGPGRGFRTPFAAMFKTGTANQYQNIWALGASNRFTVGVWLGNFSGETVIGRTGSSIPLSIAKAVLQRLHETEGTGAEVIAAGGSVFAGTGGEVEFDLPENALPMELCTLSGMAGTAACESMIIEYLPGNTNIEECTWHQLEGGRRRVVYPREYGRWLSGGRVGELESGGAGPVLIYPKNGSVFYLDPGAPPDAQAVVIKFQSDSDEAGLYVNGSYRGRAVGGRWVMELKKGDWTVELRDDAGRTSRTTFSVR